ncbi:hypothetical protein UFOVP211_36 [uncultured Caudovirales phage]|uniref:Uncharacterized protein n=1 Tax=uncultured Caudovirales phage TaxID=2100421 RepID=A0A6J7WKK1_9CAUD|nr:hypothetical protein UFOVP211_36 [uncultured Caudovirales phage]
MTTEEKLVLSTSLLPALADLLEDVPLKQVVKFKANTVINSIKALDNHITNQKTDHKDYKEAVEQQIALQLLFRNWLKTIDLKL